MTTRAAMTVGAIAVLADLAVRYTRDPSRLHPAPEQLEADPTLHLWVSTATELPWIDHPESATSAQRGLGAGLLDMHAPIRQRMTILGQFGGFPT